MSSSFPSTVPLVGLPQAVIAKWELVDDEDDPCTGPAPYAISLDTVKSFVNIPLEDTFFDAEKQNEIAVAQAAIEDYCQLAMITSSWVAYVPGFYSEMRLFKRPFVDVTSVKYVDPTTGIITTLDPETYIAGRTAQKCGSLTLGEGHDWPAVARRWDAVRITITAGWTKAKLPREFVSAMLMTIGALDRARGDSDSGGGTGRSVYAMKHQKAPSILPIEAMALLARHKYCSVVTT